MRLYKLSALATLSLLAVSSQAWVVDFEDQIATSSNFTYPGGHTLLNISVAGNAVDVYRSGGEDFDVTDNTTMAGMPGDWGNRSLAPFVAADAGDWFVFDFLTAPITEFSAQLGDYGGDDDIIQWMAFDGLGGTGTQVGLGSVGYGTTTVPTYMTVSQVFSAGARSVLIRGGNQTFPNSLFIDNFSNQAVPEPATMTVLGLGALAALKRRKRAL